MPQVDLTEICTRYDLAELMDWPAPYNKSLEKLNILLKCIASYLSRGNIEVQLDEWLNNADEGGGNLAAAQTAIIGLVADAEESSVAAMIRKSKYMLETVDYAEHKMRLGDGMAVIFLDYTEKLSELDGLNNEVIRQETSKQAPLTTIDETINSNELAFQSLKNYFAKEPGENAYYGAIFLLGNQFNDHLTDADILATVDEASIQDIRSILRTNGK